MCAANGTKCNEQALLAIEYYRKLKNLYRKQVSKSEFIYIYTNDCVVDHVLFKYRKQRYENINDVPHDTLLLTRDKNKKLPSSVIVQVKFSPLEFQLYEA